MSGALEHFFDQIYYQCLDATVQRPCALHVDGTSDLRAVGAIAQGLGGARRLQ